MKRSRIPPGILFFVRGEKTKERSPRTSLGGRRGCGNIFPLSQQSIPRFRAAPSPQGEGGFLSSAPILYTVPLTVSVTLPGVTAYAPSCSLANDAAGTVIAPGTVANRPVCAS